MGSKNRSAARFRICSGHRSDSRSGGSGGWKAAGTNEERKRRAGVHFPGRHLLLASCRSGTRFSGGARRASSSLVPRLAPRGFPVRRGWRGGERQGWRGGASSPHVDQVPGSAGMVGRERDAKRHEHRVWAAVCAGERTGCQGEKKRRCALASARGGGAGILPPRRSGSRFSAGRRGGERAGAAAPLNAIRPALFVRGDSLWIPAATYLPGPSPAKYCGQKRA